MKFIKSQLVDIDKIVECYISAFPMTLSSKLGRRFLAKMFEWYVVSERGFIFHSEQNNTVTGFCGGIITKTPGLPGAITSISQYAFYTFIISYLLKPYLIFHPQNLKKINYIFKNILIKLKIIKAEKKVSKSNFQPFCGLVVIGVKKSFQGQGLGYKIMKEFEKYVRSLKHIKFISLSVKKKNIKAINTYKKSGWSVDKKLNNSIKFIKYL